MEINVLIVEPGKPPVETKIKNELKVLQDIVGGYIQPVYPIHNDGDEKIVILCNEEGKVSGLPMNRYLYDSEGIPYDVICGTFIVLSTKEDEFASLPPEMVAKYKEVFT